MVQMNASLHKPCYSGGQFPLESCPA